MDYIAFFAAIQHSQIDYVLEVLKEYDIGAYLLGSEITQDAHKETNGEQIHFLVQMNDKDYHKYSKRIFKDKYNLRGKALKDSPRQYGRVKKIEDVSRMAAYTLKDNNIRSNMTEEQLASYKLIAFKIKDKEDFRETLMLHIKDEYKKLHLEDKFGISISWTKTQIWACILGYYRKAENKLPVNNNQIISHINYYYMYHTDMTNEEIAFVMQN